MNFGTNCDVFGDWRELAAGFHGGDYKSDYAIWAEPVLVKANPQ